MFRVKFREISVVLTFFSSYATICMALHEMPKIFRAPILREMGRVSKRVIAVDYSVKMPVSLAKFRNLFLEFFAGGGK